MYLTGADGVRGRYHFDSSGPQYLTYSFSYDPQGSLAQLQSTSNYQSTPYRLLESTFFYDAWGTLVQDVKYSSAQQTSPVGAQGFGGQFGYYQDPETALYELGARYYDPGAGRFVTRDPLGYGGGANLYGFCGNNPVNEQDPSGLIIEGELDNYPGKDPVLLARKAKVDKDIMDARTWLLTATKVKGNGAISPATIFAQLDKSSNIYFIDENPVPKGDSHPEAGDQFTVAPAYGGDISWDPASGLQTVDNDGNPTGTQAPALILLHELGHAYHYDMHPKQYPIDINTTPVIASEQAYDNIEEQSVIEDIETPAAKALHQGVRYNHRGPYLPAKSVTSRP